MRIRKLLGQVSVVALCAVSLSACADKMYYGSELGQGAGGTDQQGTNGTNGTNGYHASSGTAVLEPAIVVEGEAKAPARRTRRTKKVDAAE